jgi:hypothetical protein
MARHALAKVEHAYQHSASPAYMLSPGAQQLPAPSTPHPPAQLLENLPEAVEAGGHAGVAAAVHSACSLQAAAAHLLRIHRPRQQQHAERLQVLQRH